MRHDDAELVAVGDEALLGPHLVRLREPHDMKGIEHIRCLAGRVDDELLTLVAADRAPQVRMLGDRIRCRFHRERRVERHAPVHVHELVVHFDIAIVLPDLERRGRRMHGIRKRHGYAVRIRVVEQGIVVLESCLARRRKMPIVGRVCLDEEPHSV